MPLSCRGYEDKTFFQFKSVFICLTGTRRAILRARLHTGKFSSDKKISFVLNPLVAHGSSQDKEKLSVQGKFSCV